VIVEWMPECLRDSHIFGGSRGRYPHNGAHRLRVEKSCADLLIEQDPEWAEIVESA
jgi:hypothetical protein